MSIMNDVLEAKKLITFCIQNKCSPQNPQLFSEYSQTYYCTNESILGYLKLLPFVPTKALTVLSSGDHYLNLITQGTLDITTFDVNRISPYIAFGLKQALIRKYNYQDYLNMSTHLASSRISLEEFTYEMLNLTDYMDTVYQEFWVEIIKFNQENQNHINLLNILCQNAQSFKFSIKGNNFLLNEEGYNLLKGRLKEATIKHYHQDFLTMLKNEGSYDLIMLSNILTYFAKFYQKPLNREELIIILNKLNFMLREKGVVFLDYLFDYETKKIENHKDILQRLTLECQDILALSLLYEKDGIILKRNK